MHHHIQRGKVRSQVINVPDGFPELLSDITREVLRCQPSKECLCQFIIDYLHSIIVTRDKARVAKSIIDRALRTVDEIIEDMCICDITKAKAEKMSASMEECFKRFLAKRRCEKGFERPIIKFNEYDMIDQLIEKCKFSDDELMISKPIIEAAYQKFVDAYMMAQENTEGTECLYQYFIDREIKRAEHLQRVAAATKIQAIYRGFSVRKSMLFEKSIIPDSRQSSKVDEELDQAARTIQNFFRQRIQTKRERSVNENVEKEAQEICSPTSNVSLTAHSAGHETVEKDKTAQDVEQNERSSPDGGAKVEDQDATVEEVNVEEVHQTTEETTVQFEFQETTEVVNDQGDLQQATEEIKEAPSE